MSPKFSVFTPSHDPKYLEQCYNSLCRQDVARDDWEWVILLNGGATLEDSLSTDSRVKIYHANPGITAIGELKQLACSNAVGEILVELDHDDTLRPDALRLIGAAFDAHPSASLVYSDTLQVTEDLSPDLSRFNEANGWEYHEIYGEYIYAPAMEPTPHNVSYIWYAPNHVRAFTRAAYDLAGGYNPDLEVLDDQDLMARLYQLGEFVHIKEVLYAQRMHENNTQRNSSTNAFIQNETIRMYDRTVEQNALAWAARENLLSFDLGAAHNRPTGYLGVDQYDGDGVDIVATLPHGLKHFAAGSVGVIRAVDFLEHVTDKVAMMNEIYRLLAPGGMLLSQTPSTDGRGAFQDPTHTAFWNENSFWYYTEENYRKFVPEIEARFQVSRLLTDFPSQWHREHNISYVYANLIAVKDGMPRNGGPLFV